MVKKLTYYKNFNIRKSHKKSIILIGNFDGVHLGHQKLFSSAKNYKKKENLKIGVVTFDPIPKMFFIKKLKNYRISSLNQKLNIFKKFNVDFVINKKFDKKFSKIKCSKFISEIIHKKLNAKLSEAICSINAIKGVYFGAENPKGELGFYINSKGGGVPHRLKIRSPSFANLSILPQMLPGHMVSDVVVILGSLDFVMGECDR